MSRNFDLMQQLEIDRGYDSDRIVASVLPAPDENRSRERHADWAYEEALRLVQQIFLLQTQEPPRVVVFAGIDHGNGCSRISGAVAETLARNSRKSVCLVEANFRSPAQPGLFGCTKGSGLTDALLQDGPIQSFVKLVGHDMLFLLPSGALAADSPNLLSSERLRARLAELRAEYDFVIIDAPPLIRYADAIALGQRSDGLILVLEAESTRKKAALAVATTLRSSNVPILGAVLNKRTFPIPEKIYSRL